MATTCLKCNYSVTEPLCASCIINEIRIWLSEKPIKNERIRKINRDLNNLLNRIKSLDYVVLPSPNLRGESTMKCVRCRKEMNLMCLYCVTNQASQIVKDNLKSEDSMESFHESFNTDLYDYELSKEKNAIIINEAQSLENNYLSL